MKLLKKLFTTLFLITPMIVSCSTTSSSDDVDYEDDTPLTMMTYTRQYGSFEEALHKVYPEVDIEFISYKGSDATDYALTQLRANDIPDIFCISAPPVDNLQTANLYDLSAESFINNFSNSVISDLSIDGGVYLVPTTISLLGIYYNKTLFKEHGWEVPNSLSDLETLVPKIKAAGVEVAENYNQYPGTAFAHFFDVNAEYFSTLEGIKWMKDFIAGNKTATGTIEKCAENFQKWIDLEMFRTDEDSYQMATAKAKFKEGNTAFLLPNTNFDFYENPTDKTGDEYGILPFFSSDGTNNKIVTLGSTYYGISKNLVKKPKKLAKALKLMSFLATKDGQDSLTSAVSNTIYSLKSESISEDNPLYNVAKLVDQGQTFPYVQTGWDNYMSNFGQAVLDMVSRKLNGSQLIAYLDELQVEVKANDGLPRLATVEEDLEKEDVAKLVGTAFGKATGADCALVSLGDFHGHGIENSKGVNAKIYSSVKLDKNVICTFNPLGWSGKIQTLTLTGATIKQWVTEGFYYKTQTEPYPYCLIKPEGMEIEDEKTYKVAVPGEYNERATLGNQTATTLVGQTVLEEYVKTLKNLNKTTILWND